MSRRYRLSFLLAASVLAAWACVSHAQTTAMIWIGLLPSSPGTPATITLDQIASTTQQTVLDVTIYGFWDETKLGSDGLTYHAISIPGLPGMNVLGSPDLPVLRVAG